MAQAPELTKEKKPNENVDPLLDQSEARTAALDAKPSVRFRDAGQVLISTQIP